MAALRFVLVYHVLALRRVPFATPRRLRRRHLAWATGFPVVPCLLTLSLLMDYLKQCTDLLIHHLCKLVHPWSHLHITQMRFSVKMSQPLAVRMLPKQDSVNAYKISAQPPFLTYLLSPCFIIDANFRHLSSFLSSLFSEVILDHASLSVMWNSMREGARMLAVLRLFTMVA